MQEGTHNYLIAFLHKLCHIVEETGRSYSNILNILEKGNFTYCKIEVFISYKHIANNKNITIPFYAVKWL